MSHRRNAASETAAYPSISYLVWRLSMRWQTQLSDHLEPVGITPAEYAVLAHLEVLSASGARPSQRELADAVGLEAMYISKLARSLEGNRLVTRTRNPNDPRAIRLALTRRGARLLTEARSIASSLEAKRLASLGGRSGDRATEFKGVLQLLITEAEAPTD